LRSAARSATRLETTATCGVTAAGANGNRTSFSDTFDGGAPTTVAYCYDAADRLTGTTVTGAPTGASPVSAGNLTTTGPGATLAYDARGNVKRDDNFAAVGLPGVFVAGDAGRGQSLIVWAIAEGRSAAAAADEYLTGTSFLPAPIEPTTVAQR